MTYFKNIRKSGMKKSSSRHSVEKSGTPKGKIKVQLPCSCGGENEHCFKCSGTGLVEKFVDKSDAHLYEPGGERYWSS